MSNSFCLKEKTTLFGLDLQLRRSDQRPRISLFLDDNAKLCFPLFFIIFDPLMGIFFIMFHCLMGIFFWQAKGYTDCLQKGKKASTTALHKIRNVLSRQLKFFLPCFTATLKQAWKAWWSD